MTDQADDIEVLNAAISWMDAGQRVALATVIRTWGSSPRPPGALFAMNNNGQFVGSVSGGCVEETLVEHYRAGEIAGPTPTIMDFGVDQQEATRMGLPCGGRLELLVEELSAVEPINQLLTRLQEGELVARRVDLITAEVSLLPGDGGVDLQVSENEVIKRFGPAWQLVLIGNGQLARHLASMARLLDYRVIICDPRDEYVEQDPLIGVQYRREMPDDVVRDLSDHQRTAVVALAHDPRQDDMGLCAALESQAFYIGALGSTRSAQARRERLQTLGYSAQQIERIHGPAGIYIGSKRPAEIALSMLAQITAIRNGIKQPQNTDE